ncbi:MAG: Chitin binding protein [Fibrobacteres bacterium]|nr:Chitin binding protein [Fibrobacterota bacterium]
MKKVAPTFASLILGLALSSFTTASAAAEAAPRDTNIILKDPRVFKCICYSGYRDGQGPGQSEPNETQVREDLTLIQKFTHEIRTYGSGKGGHGYFVPKIADELGLTVHLGVWVDATYDDAVNLAAVNDAIALLKEGHKSIKSVVVGNEYMLRVRHPEITPTPNIKPDKVQSEAKLVNYVKMVKAAVPAGVLVTSADTWSNVVEDGDALLSQLDFVTWHLHPWWENQPIAGAVNYVALRYKAVQDRVAKIPGGKRLVLGETGWPTLATNGPAVGSPENQTRFFKELTTWGWNNNAEFWSFTAFDEKWKDAEGTVGGHWGFWNTGRQPLAIINAINTLYPKYMWSENPDKTTGLRKPLLSPVKASAIQAVPADALGRSLETLSGKNPYGHGRVLTPSNGSRGLYILAP